MKLYEESAEYIEKRAAKSIKSNAKYLFTYLKKFSKVKSNIGPLRNDDDELVSEPKDKAEMLSRQYASVFSTPCNMNGADMKTRPSHSLNDIHSRGGGNSLGEVDTDVPPGLWGI